MHDITEGLKKITAQTDALTSSISIDSDLEAVIFRVIWKDNFSVSQAYSFACCETLQVDVIENFIDKANRMREVHDGTE